MTWLRRIVAYFAAVATTAVVGCIASTHFVLRRLTALGVSIGFGDWFHALGHDVLGMGPLLGVLVAICFLIAFPVAALVVRFLPSLRTVGYMAAGAVAILVALHAMETALATVPIAGARTPLGLAAQGVAGAVGGLVFALLSRNRQQTGGRARTETLG